MEKQNNMALVGNCDNMYVTFEQAEMLVRKLNYKEKCNHAYDVETKELIEFPSSYKVNHNQDKSWQGIHGWKYHRYSAPTKDEVIAYLSEIAQWYSSELNKTINELNEAKGTH